MMTTKEREWPNYRTLWRWHFYAGLFCIPFVIFLSLTGSIYLFKPQIEAYLDRDFEQLAAPELHKPLSEQVGKVLVAFPDAKSVQVELPKFQEGATRVILKSPNKHLRVFVHPRTLDILETRNEAEAPMRIIKQLHGQLRFGTWGSYIVELAASWTLIMLLTGLALWWPRNAKGLGGVLYPRLHKGSRVACRDFHSVLGMWVSIFAMFLIVTGLPWAKFWGSYFRSVRAATGLVATQQDWTLGGQGTSKRGSGAIPKDLTGFDRALAVARNESLAFPVLLVPPNREKDSWTVSSEAQNRPLRESLTIDPVSGSIQSRETFRDKHWLDRLVSIGIAAHEGQLFGPWNQVLGLLTTMGLILLSGSGAWMWWRRRSPGTLGAPEPVQSAPIAWGLWSLVIALGVALPLFGLTVTGVFILEKASSFAGSFKSKQVQ